MKRPIIFAAALLLAVPRLALADVDRAVLEAETQRIDVMAKAKQSVLAIFSSSGRGGGSGVVISPDGYALTNFHVVKPCGNAMKCGMADGNLYDAVIVGIDPTGDIGLIKLLGRDDFPSAELADSDQVRAGDWAFAMGNPFLLATDFQPTVTYGIISGVHRYQYPAGTLLEYADCLQTDASINPGNSGGPLFDAQGRLIGINGRGSFEKRGRVNVGVGYAVSINQIKNFLGHLRSGRIVDHATLGSVVGFDDDGRVVVVDILEQSDAFRRGLRYDDEIVSLGGRPIYTPNGFKNVLGIYPKGWRIPLSFRREGVRYDVLVRLAGVHARSELLEKVRGRRPMQPVPIPQPGDDPEKPKSEKPGSGEPKPDEPGPGEPGSEESKPEEPGPEEPDSDEPKPDEGKPDEGKPDNAPRRIQIPIPRPGDHPPMPIGRPPQPIPEIVKKHFEEKRGYANYYFNKLHRDRVWKAWTAKGDFASLGGTWTIGGPLDGGGRFDFELTDSEILLKLPARELKWPVTDELGSSLAPPGSGGLFTALHLWRRLAVEGPGNFGEVYYLGTVPLPGHEGLVDVLVGVQGGVECRFLFDPPSGDLLALEMFPEDHVDPCQIFFSEYREVEGRFLPGRMEVRLGDDLYGMFSLDQFRFEKSPQP